MSLKIQKSPQPGQCIVCGKRLGLFRRLAGNTFCTTEHEEQYLADLRELALTRLQDACAEPGHTRSTAV
jgi:hypothetical protein